MLHPPPVRDDEAERLEALRAYDILDSKPEAAFDGLVRAASLALGSEVSLVSLVDEDRQWFKAKVGIDAPEIPRDVSFCAWAVYDREPLVVFDATEDERFRDNPLVTGGPEIRFYAGSPLRTEEGHVLGSLCVIDSKPRTEFTDREVEVLELLAGQVMHLIESRRVSSQLASALREVRVLAPMVPVCAWCRRIRDDEDYWATLEEYLRDQAGSLASHSICPKCEADFNDQLGGKDTPVG